MAKATFWQKGEVLDYVNTTENVIPANTIVSLTTRIGVVGMDIEAGAVGALHVEGVFKMPKATGEITLGAAVYYNTTDNNITTTKTSNVPAGYAVAAAGADDQLVAVKLLG